MGNVNCTDRNYSATDIWLRNLATRSKSTQKIYQIHFSKFLEWTDMTPDEIRDMKWKEDKSAKPWERSQVENLVRQYMEEHNDLACNTQHLKITAIKSFFKANNLTLNLTSKDDPKGCAFGSKVPTKEDIKKMLDACETIRDRALILFLKDSGLRESDLEGLRWEDLKTTIEGEELPKGFYHFQLETRKKKTLARGFIGPECSEPLLMYKRKRELGTDIIKPEKNINSHPVFINLMQGRYYDAETPMNANSMSKRIGKIISLAGLEGITPHGIRKFWEQHVRTDKPVYIKQLNGRSLDATERAYFWLTPKQLFKIYLENYPNLRIRKRELADIERRLSSVITSQKVRINSLEKELERYRTKSKQDLQSEINERDSELSALKQDLNELGKRVKEQNAVISIFHELLKDDPQFVEKFRERYTKRTKEAED